MTVFTANQLSVIRFCAIECELQMSGERSVAWMLNAVDWAATKMTGPVTQDHILSLGLMVEPDKNLIGYRRPKGELSGNVRVGMSIKPGWEDVHHLMNHLLEHQDELGPAEFFRQYEEIHPFFDGNGRTGAILFNYLAGTLDEPDWPPNFWHDPRRRPDAGAPRTP